MPVPGAIVNLDVVILAGGRGTRLRGLWNDAKCLVPLGDGRPIIEHLVERCLALAPRRATLLLGAHEEGVLEWMRLRTAKHPSRLIRARTDPPQGTAVALRRYLAAYSPLVDGPSPDALLVLNGDTLPLFDLDAVLRYHASRLGAWATIAVVHDAAAWRDIYAGAAVLGRAAQDAVARDERAVDLAVHLLGAQRFVVPGFLDVGTPPGFREARAWWPREGA